MSFDISEWTWVHHLAVWPLLTLVLGLIVGFTLLTVTDPTVPDEDPAKAHPSPEERGSAAPRHRA